VLELILEHKASLCNELRQYTKSQLDLWQQVPWLSLHADGRDGAMGHPQYAPAYLSGSWALSVDSKVPYYYRPYVDCATGEIQIVKNSVHSPATDDDLLPLLRHIDQLDAAAVIADLQQQSSSSRPSWISKDEAKKRMIYRQRVIESFGLTPCYHRDQIAA
jgi:hypothetical protein